MIAVEAVFWGSFLWLLYTFVGFPLLVVVRGMWVARPPATTEFLPRITVIVPAHNEASSIERKLCTVLEADYPPSCIQVVVASDGSTDATTEIVRAMQDDRVRLLDLPRAGKAAALEAAVGVATGEILVFTDANSLLAEQSLRELVAPFADEAVGGVAGNQVYRTATMAQDAQAGEKAYWTFDRLLKEHESRAGSVTSATGALYSIRRHLFEPVPPHVSDDFYLSLGVIQAHRRLVFAAKAVAFEPPVDSLAAEFRRKVRVLTRAIHCMYLRRKVLDVRLYGFYSLQVFSHKILRWAMVIPLAMLGVTSFALAGYSPLYSSAAAVQLVGYGAGVVGLLAQGTAIGRTRALSMPAYFLAANVALAVALTKALSGRSMSSWSPTRQPAAARPEYAPEGNAEAGFDG